MNEDVIGNKKFGKEVKNVRNLGGNDCANIKDSHGDY